MVGFQLMGLLIYFLLFGATPAAYGSSQRSLAYVSKLQLPAYATPTAYESSQARGLIGPAATSLSQSLSNLGSELSL